MYICICNMSMIYFVKWTMRCVVGILEIFKIEIDPSKNKKLITSFIKIP